MVIEFDSREFFRSLRKAKKDLSVFEAEIPGVIVEAQINFGGLIIAEASLRAPYKKGGLINRAVVTDGIETDDGVIVFAGFNIKYARIQDQGGVIRPTGKPSPTTGKPTTTLFIPLRDGVRPIAGKEARKASGNKFGIDFVLAKEAILVGNLYWESTLEQFTPEAATLIGSAISARINELERKLR